MDDRRFRDARELAAFMRARFEAAGHEIWREVAQKVMERIAAEQPSDSRTAESVERQWCDAFNGAVGVHGGRMIAVASHGVRPALNELVGAKDRTIEDLKQRLRQATEQAALSIQRIDSLEAQLSRLGEFRELVSQGLRCIEGD